MKSLRIEKIKNVMLIILVLCIVGIAWHEDYFTSILQYFRSNYSYLDNDKYIAKCEVFSLIEAHSNIVFAGDSLTDYCEWNEILGDISVANRGIAGDVSEGLLNRLDTVISCEPMKIFIMIGTNDLTHNIEVDEIIENYRVIIAELHGALPDCVVYLESVLPTSNAVKNQKIQELNGKANSYAEKYDYVEFIDLYGEFVGSDGLIQSEYTIEGVHLTDAGYDLWMSLIERYVLY